MMVRWALAGVMVIGAVTGAIAGEKPRVPPGRDPGGVAIAIVGAGIDYTQAGIAARLARDGEGEIVGFDLIDNDRRPYAAAGADMRAAGIVVRQAAESRLVVFRADGAVQASVGRALAMTAMSPARIVLIDGQAAGTLRWEGLVAVSQRLAGRLVVVAVDGAMGPGSEAEGLANVLVVRGCVTAGAGCVVAGDALALADVVVPVDAAAGETSGDAAARVVALAGRVLAAVPELDGAALKAKIVGLGTAVPGARHRVIADPGQVGGRAP